MENRHWLFSYDEVSRRELMLVVFNGILRGDDRETIAAKEAEARARIDARIAAQRRPSLIALDGVRVGSKTSGVSLAAAASAGETLKRRRKTMATTAKASADDVIDTIEDARTLARAAVQAIGDGAEGEHARKLLAMLLTKLGEARADLLALPG